MAFQGLAWAAGYTLRGQGCPDRMAIRVTLIDYVGRGDRSVTARDRSARRMRLLFRAFSESHGRTVGETNVKYGMQMCLSIPLEGRLTQQLGEEETASAQRNQPIPARPPVVCEEPYGDRPYVRPHMCNRDSALSLFAQNPGAEA